MVPPKLLRDMNREHLFTGLFLIALGVVLAVWFGTHGKFFGFALVGFGVLITFNSFSK